MYIHQYLLDQLVAIGRIGKVIILCGPRRVGKTTLLEKLTLHYDKSYILLNGDDVEVQNYLSSCSIEILKNFIGNKKILIIDEAQKIPNVGINLKLLIDNIKDLMIIATGSSAFDLNNNLGEPLTGRKISFNMYPLAQLELNKIETPIQTKARLEKRLIYGSYPEVIINNDRDLNISYLRELSSDYLYKDILSLDGIKKSNKIQQLLQLLAFQIGNEVSTLEIATRIGLNKGTVDRYIELLIKNFIIIPLYGFSRNLRNEVTKKPKYYFYDLGIRNALINNFASINLRNDVGSLWENYLFVERLKKQNYLKMHISNYFWRTYSKQEIDLIEDKDGKLNAYEFKWSNKKRVKPPSEWQRNYPDSIFTVITPDNYIEFISK